MKTATEGYSLDDVTFDYEEGGQKIREQLAKKVVATTGVWATIAFLHRSLELRDLSWKPPQITLARFKRINGIWKKQSSFNINSRRQLDQMMSFLAEHGKGLL